jgi:hypothetical protein
MTSCADTHRAAWRELPSQFSNLTDDLRAGYTSCDRVPVLPYYIRDYDLTSPDVPSTSNAEAGAPAPEAVYFHRYGPGAMQRFARQAFELIAMSPSELLVKLGPKRLGWITQALKQGANVLVIGSGEPVVESIFIALGAKSVVTTDFTKLAFAHESIRVTQPKPYTASTSDNDLARCVAGMIKNSAADHGDFENDGKSRGEQDSARENSRRPIGMTALHPNASQAYWAANHRRNDGSRGHAATAADNLELEVGLLDFGANLTDFTVIAAFSRFVTVFVPHT